MGFSYSKVETHASCPYKFKLRYIDKLETKPDMSASNALYLGTACHEGIENRSLDKAVESYKSNYENLEDDNFTQIERLKRSVEIAIKEIPEGEYERKLTHSDGFIGFIDCLVEVEPNVYDMYDFKYSNNTSYKESGQLHVYKYYFETLTGNKIRNMYYALIPKYDNKLTEDLDTYFSNKHVTLLPIEYDRDKVSKFFAKKTLMEKDTKFLKNRNWKCRWCEYRAFCESLGKDKSELLDPSKAELSLLKEVELF